MGSECRGRDPEAESMELGCCAVYLEDVSQCTTSVLLQSSTGVYDFLLGHIDDAGTLCPSFPAPLMSQVQVLVSPAVRALRPGRQGELGER